MLPGHKPWGTAGRIGTVHPIKSYNQQPGGQSLPGPEKGVALTGGHLLQIADCRRTPHIANKKAPPRSNIAKDLRKQLGTGRAHHGNQSAWIGVASRGCSPQERWPAKRSKTTKLTIKPGHWVGKASVRWSDGGERRKSRTTYRSRR